VIADTIDFLRALFGAVDEGLVNLRMICSAGEVREEFFALHDVDHAASWAVERRERGNVFVGVLPRTVPRGDRSSVGAAHWVWADCDSPESVAALGHFPLLPSMTVRSGSGDNAHAYWRLAEPITLDEIERLNRRLAQALGSDTRVVDAARVMRIPGTLNHKHEPPTDAELVNCTDDAYQAAVLTAALPELHASRPRRAKAAALADGPTSRVLSLLDGVTATTNGWKARCPAHDDTNPSLTVSEGDDERCLVHCFAGCTGQQVTAALGMQMSDLFVAPTENADDGHRGQSLAQTLVSIAEDAEVLLFHDAAGNTYARVPTAEHHEVWTLGSQKFKRWLRHELYRREERVAKAESLTEAVELLSARADFDGPETEVKLRSSWTGDGLVYNLADAEGRAVTVTPRRWSVDIDVEAMFLKRNSVQPLPVPEAGGSIDLLRSYTNVESDEDFMLLVAWLLMVLRPTGPYPALGIQGQQGSAKSTLARVLKSLVDPVEAPLRSLPGSLRDLAITADSNWVLAVDNLSMLKESMSDAFCRLATGGGFATRALYTDDEERIFNQMRATILNGIDAIVTRQDLLGRSIVLRLPKIDKHKRVDEQTFWAEFERDKPKILGALFDGASTALKAWPATAVEGLRMADFARWAAAGVTAYGWSSDAFISAYEDNLSGALKASLEGSLLAAVLLRFASHESGIAIEGEPTAVRKTLRNALTEEEGKSRDFPANAQVMSRMLSLLAPALAEVGIEVVISKRGSGKSKTRWISIRSSGTHGTDGTPLASTTSHGADAHGDEETPG